MKTVQVTIKLEMEVDDPQDKELMKERVHEHLEELMDDDSLEFKTKVLASDEDEDEEPEFEDDEDEIL